MRHQKARTSLREAAPTAKLFRHRSIQVCYRRRHRLRCVDTRSQLGCSLDVV
ncbi:hypothetical protein [Nostoc sp.]